VPSGILRCRGLMPVTVYLRPLSRRIAWVSSAHVGRPARVLRSDVARLLDPQLPHRSGTANLGNWRWWCQSADRRRSLPPWGCDNADIASRYLAFKLRFAQCDEARGTHTTMRCAHLSSEVRGRPIDGELPADLLFCVVQKTEPALPPFPGHDRRHEPDQ